MPELRNASDILQVADKMKPSESEGVVDCQGWLNEMAGGLFYQSPMKEMLRPFEDSINLTMISKLQLELVTVANQITGIRVAAEMLRNSSGGEFGMNADERIGVAKKLDEACEVVFQQHEIFKDEEDGEESKGLVRAESDRYMTDKKDWMKPEKHDALVRTMGNPQAKGAMGEI